MNENHWVVKPIVPADVYTDRAEFLDYFYRAALKAATRRTMSTVMLGPRRMGKTEIFKRVVNRLFFEQDPTDPQAVVPVYYSFPDRVKDDIDFAVDYVENFLKYYVGFYTRQPNLVTEDFKGKKLLTRIDESRKLYPFRKTLDLMLMHYDSLFEGVNLPEKTALWLPRMISDIDETTNVVFLDEFQNTRLPEYTFDVVGWMQHAVESPTCPHFVTGSAMSILSREIIGRGSLFGRFRGEEIEPLTSYYGTELALNAARYYKVNLSEVLASVVSDRCGGNPFYINAVVQQAAESKNEIDSEQSLNKLMAVDISSGFIWGELHDQVTRWIERINQQGITKWVLYLSAIQEDEYLSIETIQQQLWERDRRDVSQETIRDVLIKLSRGDLLEFLELGNTFRKVSDPILLEFLRVWGRIEVEGHNSHKVEDELRSQYDTLARRFHEYKGYLAEVFMSQVLWTGQDKTLPGRLFNTNKDITMPDRFSFVEQRMRVGTGEGQELDLVGGAGPEAWICQSRWVVGKRQGVNALHELLAQREVFVEHYAPNRTVTLWLFAYKGLTKEAQKFAKRHRILWSNREQLDELLVLLGLRPLPDLDEST